MKIFSRTLQNLKDKNRYRSLALPHGVDMSSNDYLGLKDHPVMKRAALEAIDGGISMGSGGSRLLRGHCLEHAELEEYAADHYGFERTLYFANGFMANYALFTTLPSRHDVVLFDSLIHASVRDGIQGAHAKSVKIPHNDLNAYEDALKRFSGETEQVYIAVESVYSMDGDMAPLAELYELAQAHGAILIVDEAHGTGAWGERGKGASYGLSPDNLITLHTCGKALGVAGGLVCASAEIIDYMVNSSRPFIYSTAPPPLQAYLTRRAMELSASDEGEALRAKLHGLCKQGQELFGGFGSQIIPVVLGEDGRAVEAAKMLQAQGYDIRAVRPPSVPEGEARLRLSLNVELTEDILCKVADILGVV